MIKLVCQDCKQVWYTANTRPNQKCCQCNGKLVEISLITSKDIETVSENNCEKKTEGKVIYLKTK